MNVFKELYQNRKLIWKLSKMISATNLPERILALYGHSFSRW